MELPEIYRPIDEELTAVEELLASTFVDCDYPLIADLGQFLMASPGKRTRPAMTILSAMAAGNAESRPLIAIASAFEFIHMASLIHDDIIDRATMRHNRQSVNARWGNGPSVIFGDFLYSRAFQLIADHGKPEIYSCICTAVSSMCKGELNQLTGQTIDEMTEQKYLDIVRGKTASLFAGCCKAGALLATDDKTVHNAMADFGVNLGIAFQIVDDIRDITSNPDDLGKLPGQDIITGQVTLPVINIINSVTGPDRQKLCQTISQCLAAGDFSQIRTLFTQTSAHQKTIDQARHYTNLARESLDILSVSEYKTSLDGLVDFFIDKTLLLQET